MLNHTNGAVLKFSEALLSYIIIIILPLYSYASSAYDESLCDVKYKQELIIQEECLVLNDAKNITGT
ncbi:hypothetical protein I7I53_04046 [Histoplasma capsulatum var. duboisii H88]|uniref:Uncharacterized protein n=1 Tax=Ajellomyces capsulatus (strain H88) TaxID=544711 RepID=A0A8A1LQD1_AJEC8|nr:hypothetical protein I7I53_04046 [Histoplasma capsulatum var. duboisii H88]